MTCTYGTKKYRVQSILFLLCTVWISVFSLSHANATPLAHPTLDRNAQVNGAPSLRSPIGPLSLRQQSLVTTGIHVAIPVLILDIIPLLGNLVALPSGAGRLTWGIFGVSFGAVGSLLTIPAMNIPYVGMALVILQTFLIVLSTTNIVLSQFFPQARENPIRLISATSHINIHTHGSTLRVTF